MVTFALDIEVENNPYGSSSVSSHEPMPSAVGQVRTLQIITFAIAMGTTVFAGFSLWSNKFAFDDKPEMLSWFGFGFAAVTFLLSLIVPRINISTVMKKIDASEVLGMDETAQFSKLFGVYQTSHIIACALLEGAAFFNVFLYMTTSFVGNIVVGAALIGLILLRFPSLHGAETWVRHHIEELRSVSR